jgi:hypothetical protein
MQHYPMAAPNGSPRAIGVEPPLGFSVEDHEPQGEKFEVEASSGDSALAVLPSARDVALGDVTTSGISVAPSRLR